MAYVAGAQRKQDVLKILYEKVCCAGIKTKRLSKDKGGYSSHCTQETVQWHCSGFTFNARVNIILFSGILCLRKDVPPLRMKISTQHSLLEIW
jgi:hypothetical protein